MPRVKRALQVISLAGVLGGSFIGGYLARSAARDHIVQRPSLAEMVYGGDEIVLVFVGAATCGPSNRPEVRASLAVAQEEFARLANERGANFVSIGIALDPQVTAGYAYLTAMGGFTEISTGSNWHNSTAIRYLWIDFPGPPVTPQLIAMSRTIALRDDGSVVLDNERVLVRRVGVDAITSWIERGMPLPSAAPELDQ